LCSSRLSEEDVTWLKEFTDACPNVRLYNLVGVDIFRDGLGGKLWFGDFGEFGGRDARDQLAEHWPCEPA